MHAGVRVIGYREPVAQISNTVPIMVRIRAKSYIEDTYGGFAKGIPRNLLTLPLPMPTKVP